MRLIIFAMVLIIIFFCAMGLTVWLTGLSVAAGATLFGVGAFSALLWLLGSIFSAFYAAEPPKKASIDDTTFSSKDLAMFMTRGGSREWESLAETKSWFNADCRGSRAIYTLKHNGKVHVRNVCFAKNGKTRDVEGEACTTDLPRVVTVSFFPGIVAQYVVRAHDDRFLLVTNKDNTNGWLLHAIEDETATDKEIAEWREKLRRVVDNQVFDIPMMR